MKKEKILILLVVIIIIILVPFISAGFFDDITGFFQNIINKNSDEYKGELASLKTSSLGNTGLGTQSNPALTKFEGWDKVMDPNDWFTYGKDYTMRSYTDFQPEPPLELAWEKPVLTGERLLASEDLVVIHRQEGIGAVGVFKARQTIKGYNGFTGEEVSEFVTETGTEFNARAPIYDGRYYWQHKDSRFRIIDIHKGTEVMAVTAGNEGGTTSGVYGNKLFAYIFGTLGGYDIHANKNIWGGSRSLYRSSPFYKGMVFQIIWTTPGEQRNNLVGVDTSKGSFNWVRQARYKGSMGFGNPVLDEGVLYVTEYTSPSTRDKDALYAIDAETGDILWTRSYRHKVQFPGVNKNVLVFCDYWEYFYDPDVIECEGLNKTNGQVLWSYNLNSVNVNSGLGHFAVSQDYFYLLAPPYLIVLNINTGEEVQKISIPFGSAPSPSREMFQMITANKMLYVSDYYGNKLYAYKGQNPAAQAGDDKVAETNEVLSFDAGNSFTGSLKTITNYQWDFGDGATGSGITATHSYSRAGIYQVALIITDSSGQQDQDTLEVEVIEPLASTYIDSVNYTKNTLKQTSDGSLILLYQDGLGNLVYKTSLDEGTTWSGSTKIYNQASFVAAAQNTNDTLFVLLYDETIDIFDINEVGKHIKLVELTYQGSGNWTIGSPLTMPKEWGWFKYDNRRLNRKNHANLMVDSQGRLWFVFKGSQKWEDSINCCWVVPYFTFSNDRGLTWSVRESIPWDTHTYASQAFLWNDKFTVIDRIAGGELTLHYLEGDTWQTASATGYTGRAFGKVFWIEEYEFEVAVTDNNYIHIVYYGGDSIKYLYKDNTSEGNWSHIETPPYTPPIGVYSDVSIGGRQDNRAKITTDGTNLWVYWEEYDQRIKRDWHYDLVFKEWDPANGWDKEPTVISNINSDTNHNLITLSKLKSSLSNIPFIWFRGKEAPYDLLSRNVSLTYSPPTANAGSDITVTDSDRDGYEVIQIDSSLSSGNIIDYLWVEDDWQGPGRHQPELINFQYKVSKLANPYVKFPVGTTNLTLIITDENGMRSEDSVIVVVNQRVNQQPIADSQQVVTDEGIPINITLSGNDPDNDNLTYLIKDIPDNGTLSGVTPDITYRPNGGFVGSDSFSFYVSDGINNSNEASVTITVNEVLGNRAPILAPIGNKKVKEGEKLIFSVSFFDPDGDTLYTSAENAPQGAFPGSSVSPFYWQPNYTQAGTYHINYTVRDRLNLSDPDMLFDSEEIIITVTESYLLNITSEYGTVTASPLQIGYVPGTEITLEAHPYTGFVFSHWSEDITNSENPVVITMDSDKNITANYVIDPTQVHISQGLLAHWAFDEGSGNVANDSSGNNYHGILKGDPNSTGDKPVWTAGRVNGALEFDGNNDYVDLGDINALEFDRYGEDRFTISLWVKPYAAYFNSGDIIGRTNNASVFSSKEITWVLNGDMWTGGGTFIMGNGVNYQYINGFPQITSNSWNHLAIVVGKIDESIDFYLDGRLLLAQSATRGIARFRRTSNSFKIGGENYYFNGTIDDVRIYNRTLNPGEVFTLAQAGVGDSKPVVNLDSPVDDSSFEQGIVNFTCSAIDDHNLKNISLYIWDSDNNLINKQTVPLGGTWGAAEFNYNFNINDTYYWNCLAYDNNSQSDWHDSNYTLTIGYVCIDEDVDCKNGVNIQDLVLVAKDIGKTGCNSGNNWCDRRDVTRDDGIVSIRDLVKVAMAI
jgi:hypothetical protein